MAIRVTLGQNSQGLPCVDWIDGTEQYWLLLWEAAASSIVVDPVSKRPTVDFSRPTFRQFPAKLLRQVIVIIPPGLSL